MKIWHLITSFSSKAFSFSVCIVFIFLSISFRSGVGAFEPPGSATGAIKSTIEEVLAILDDKNFSKPEREEERRALLEEVVGRRFDYTEMGKRSLGHHWKNFSEKQRLEFIALFQRFLSNSYSQNIVSALILAVVGSEGGRVEYVRERRKGDFSEVQTKVISKKEAQVLFDYRMVKTSNEWHVYDVIVNGVSLVKNFREQFSRILESSSYDELIEKLRVKAN